MKINPYILVVSGSGPRIIYQYGGLKAIMDIYKSQDFLYKPRTDGYSLSCSGGSIVTYIASKNEWDIDKIRNTFNKLSSDIMYKPWINTYFIIISVIIAIIFNFNSIFNSGIGLSNIFDKNDNLNLDYMNIVGTLDVKSNHITFHLLEYKHINNKINDIKNYLKSVKFRNIIFLPKDIIRETNSFKESNEIIKATASIPTFVPEIAVKYGSEIRYQCDGAQLFSSPIVVFQDYIINELLNKINIIDYLLDNPFHVDYLDTWDQTCDPNNIDYPKSHILLFFFRLLGQIGKYNTHYDLLSFNNMYNRVVQTIIYKNNYIKRENIFYHLTKNKEGCYNNGIYIHSYNDFLIELNNTRFSHNKCLCSKMEIFPLRNHHHLDKNIISILNCKKNDITTKGENIDYCVSYSYININ
jgi:hypothetical protein